VPLHHDPVVSSYGYGLKAALALITPTPPSGFFSPGDTVQFQVTYTDDQARRFFPKGSLPSYGAALFEDPSSAGMRFLTYVDDPILYWAHKNTQSDMAFTMAGPLDKLNRVGTTPVTIAQAFLPQIPIATTAVDGYSSAIQIFPPTTLVFPCLFSLAGVPAPECFQGTSDIFTLTIPADAQAGTWSAQIKARRVWEGEPVQAAASVRFPVMTVAATHFTPHVTGCAHCHTGPSSVTAAGHGFRAADGSTRVNSDLPECVSCHNQGFASWFENDSGLDKRLSYIHLLSRRFFAMGGTAADITFPSP